MSKFLEQAEAEATEIAVDIVNDIVIERLDDERKRLLEKSNRNVRKVRDLRALIAEYDAKIDAVQAALDVSETERKRLLAKSNRVIRKLREVRAAA